MSYTRRDYAEIASDLNSVLRHATPATIQDRADAMWLAALAISRTFASHNPRFSEHRFMADVFEGFERYYPTRKPATSEA